MSAILMRSKTAPEGEPEMRRLSFPEPGRSSMITPLQLTVSGVSSLDPFRMDFNKRLSAPAK